ncbi:class I SAM-dependent methyltransferase [Bizionia gelidisalsuginis]|uniref:Class I SAM-dependent methyltransferase n=1 Tax=Bizionia gelidisalsuginis TaxID=291188 RepID=A0ABY3MCI3_9FLAO|nr:class I SAM-dependent methyltransferase [Bizionia gelidisalsuginis]
MFHVEHILCFNYKLFLVEKSTATSLYETVKDFTVSGETFQLLHNSQWDYLQTNPQPSASKLPDYYKSEDYISHTNTQRNLFEKVYHAVRTISLKRKLKLINSFSSSEKKILDVGCGTGDFLAEAQKNKWVITGIEPNEKARTIANSKTGNKIVNTDALETLPSHSFDVITLWHVLEHLPNLEEHIKLFKRLLKKEGTLIIAVPNYKSYDAIYYKQFWAAFDVPRHLWHFSQEAITRLFNKKEMTVVKTLPMVFDAYYVSLLSEKYKKSKWQPVKALWRGVISNWKAKQSSEYSSLIYCITNAK